MAFITKEEREEFDRERAELKELLTALKAAVPTKFVPKDPPADGLPRYWNGAEWIVQDGVRMQLGPAGEHFVGHKGRCVHCGRLPDQEGAIAGLQGCVSHGGTFSDCPRLQSGYTAAVVAGNDPHTPIVARPKHDAKDLGQLPNFLAASGSLGA